MSFSLDSVLSAIAAHAEMTGVHPNDNLEDDLALDSLDKIEIAMALEEQAGVALSDREIAGAKTPQDFFDLITGKQEPRHESQPSPQAA